MSDSRRFFFADSWDFLENSPKFRISGQDSEDSPLPDVHLGKKFILSFTRSPSMCERAREWLSFSLHSYTCHYPSRGCGRSVYGVPWCAFTSHCAAALPLPSLCLCVCLFLSPSPSPSISVYEKKILLPLRVLKQKEREEKCEFCHCFFSNQ